MRGFTMTPMFIIENLQQASEEKKKKICKEVSYRVINFQTVYPIRIAFGNAPTLTISDV